MFGFGFLDYVKIIGGVVVGAALVFYPARFIGQSEGRQEAAVAALSNSVAVLRERNTINDEVSTADAADLCASLGLSDNDKAECVRRVLTPDAESGIVGDDPEKGPAICEPSRIP